MWIVPSQIVEPAIIMGEGLGPGAEVFKMEEKKKRRDGGFGLHPGKWQSWGWEDSGGNGKWSTSAHTLGKPKAMTPPLTSLEGDGLKGVHDSPHHVMQSAAVASVPPCK